MPGRTRPAVLAEGLVGADVFVGASAGGILSQEMIRSMNRFPVVFALATPEPEISYADARASRRDVLVATSRAVDPNAVLDLLSFPYIFRGALDVQATRITEDMLVAAAQALAELAREDVVEDVVRAYGDERFAFGPEYLLPKPIDPRIFVRESGAVAQQAIAEGVARQPLEQPEYEESLAVRFGTGREDHAPTGAQGPATAAPRGVLGRNQRDDSPRLPHYRGRGNRPFRSCLATKMTSGAGLTT